MKNKELIIALEIGLAYTEDAMATELNQIQPDSKEYKRAYENYSKDLERIQKCIDELKGVA